MLLSKSLDLTHKSLEYDEMLKACNFLSGRELELHQERMEQVAIELKTIRDEVNRLMNVIPHEKSIYLNPF